MIHSSYCWEYFNKNTTDWEVTHQVLQAVEAKAVLDLEEWKRWIRGAPTNDKGERKEKYEGRALPYPLPRLPSCTGPATMERGRQVPWPEVLP